MRKAGGGSSRPSRSSLVAPPGPQLAAAPSLRTPGELGQGRFRLHPGPLTPARLLTIQRQAGNRAATEVSSRSVAAGTSLLQRMRETPSQAGASSAPAAPVPVGPVPVVDDKQLQHALKQVIDKPEKLIAVMAPDVKAAVAAYLRRATKKDLKEIKEKDLKGLKDLLRLGDSKELKSITPEQVLAVRMKVLEFLAAGGDPKAADGYSKEWLRLAPGHLGDLQPVQGPGGKMTMEPLLGGLAVPAENRRLTQPQVQQIRAIFDDVMTKVMYNSTTIPLDFISQVQEVRKKQPGKPLSAIFNDYVPGHPALMGAAGGADCVGMAALVKRRLAEIGIGCHIIGAVTGNYLNQLPTHTTERTAWQGAKDYAAYSHSSVVIPYTDFAGTPMAIHIETGMGPDPKHFTQFATLAEANATLGRDKFGGTKYDTRNSLDPGELAKKHVKCKWRMYLSDDAAQGKKAFIDLIEGSIWLSGTGQTEIEQFQRLSGTEGTKFRFEEMMRQPSREVTITTGVEKVGRVVTAADATRLFFAAVRQQFKLPESFDANMMYLAEHLTEFRQHVLLAPVEAIANTLTIRTDALAASKAAEEACGGKRDVHKKALDAANATLADALETVKRGDEAGARQKYLHAKTAFEAIRKAAA